MATVGDVLREVLPSGTVCLAGQAALSRPTTWAAALRLRGGFADLGPGARCHSTAFVDVMQAVQHRGRTKQLVGRSPGSGV